jgi:hypothetical protein
MYCPKALYLRVARLAGNDAVFIGLVRTTRSCNIPEREKKIYAGNAAIPDGN